MTAVTKCRGLAPAAPILPHGPAPDRRQASLLADARQIAVGAEEALPPYRRQMVRGGLGNLLLRNPPFRSGRDIGQLVEDERLGSVLDLRAAAREIHPARRKATL